MSSEAVPIGGVICNFMSMDDFVEQSRRWLTEDTFRHVVTLNPEMVMLAQRDSAFAQSAASATIRVPDGAGLVWARWYLRSDFWPLWPSLLAFLFQPVERVSGVDAVIKLAQLCHERGEGVYLLGGTDQQVQASAQRLAKRFPGLLISNSSEHAYDAAGPDYIVEDIRRKQPAVLLVAYGAPKQTLWIERQRDKLPSVKIAMGVGGAFAMLSEERPRAPKLLRATNLEWLWRLHLEPARWPRIWQATVQFPLLVRRSKLDA